MKKCQIITSTIKNYYIKLLVRIPNKKRLCYVYIIA